MADIKNTVGNTLVSGTAKADTIHNTDYELQNVTIDAGAGNDFISNRTEYASINAGAGNDTVYNYYNTQWIGSSWAGNIGGHHSTIVGGAGNDSLKNDSDDVLIDGGADDDIIINAGEEVTINGGAGNDTIAISDEFGMHQKNIIEYGAGGGHDVITNFGNEDSIRLVGVSLEGGYSGLGNNSNDIILQVGDGTITIKKGRGKNINILLGDDDEAYEVAAPESVSNDREGIAIVTSDLNDYVENSGNEVQLSAGGGADYVYNSGSNVEIDAGAGNDTIKNAGENSLIDGGDGDDLIENIGANSTLKGGAGNDTINVGAISEIQYASGDGNDVIIGYDSDSTIHVTKGAISKISTDGLDVVIKVGGGTLRIKDAFEKMLTIVDADNKVIQESFGDYDITNVALYHEVSGTDNADKIKNVGDGSTVDAGAGNDTILNEGANVYIKAGAGNDYIDDQSFGETTINAGAGNDTVRIANDAPHVIEYSAGEGNDIIIGYGESDSIKLLNGSIGKATVNGSDVIFTVAKNTVTLKDASGLTITFVDAEGNIISSERYGPINVDNFDNGSVVAGTAYDDTITNWVDNATVNGGNGNDFIENYGNVSSLAGGAGADTILNSADSITANGGAGDDLIDNAGNYAVLNAGAGNDYILNSGRRVTVNTGAGDDTFEAGSDYGEVFIYNATDGNDVILNYSTNDTIQIATGSVDSYEYVTTSDGSNSRTDYVATIKSGKSVGTLTLRDIGSNKFKYSQGQIVVDGNSYDEPIELFNDDDNKIFDADTHADAVSGSRYYMINLVEGAEIRTGSRDDTVEGSDFYGELFTFGNQDGNDVIVNFNDNDTLKALSGTIFNSIVSGDDVIVSIGSASKYSTVTLKNTADKTFKIKNNNLIIESAVELSNKKSNVKFSGTSGNDLMSNTGNNVTISGNGGDDTIEGSTYGELIQFGATDGNDIIVGFDTNDTIQITNGAIQSHSTDGDDYVFVVKSANFIGTLRLQGLAGRNFEIDALGNIRLVPEKGNPIINNDDDKKVSGTSGNDLITNSGNNVTIAPGKGNDTIVGSNFGELVHIAYNNGDNVFANFDSQDSIQASGDTLSTQESGDDLLVKVTKGNTSSTILLKNTKNISDPFEIVGNTLRVNRIVIIDNGDDSVKVDGGDENNIIINTGEYVTIQSYGGDDTITGSDEYGDTYLFGAADDNNVITNFGNGDLLTVSSANSTLSTEVAGDDVIAVIKNASSTAKVTLQGAAQYTDSLNAYKLVKDGNSLSVEKKINYFEATKNNRKVTGTTGVDYISNSGFTGITMQGGTGDDTFDGSNFGEMYLVSHASGDDVIVSFDSKDTLRSTGGTISAIETVDNDLLVTISKGTSKGTVLLKDGAKFMSADSAYHLETTTTLLTAVSNVNTVRPTKNKQSVNGTSGPDFYINDGDYENVTMVGSAGDDTFEGSELYGEIYHFSYNRGNNVITNFNEEDTLQITSGTLQGIGTVGDDAVVSIKGSKESQTTLITLQGAGDKTFKVNNKVITIEKGILIDNDEPNTLLIGGDGNDTINNTAENVTLKSSGGTDIFTGSDFYGELYQLSSVDGGNVITNFGSNDTIEVIKGKGSIYSTVLSDDGNDLIVALGKASTAGTVTLQGVGAYTSLIKKSGNYLIFDDVEVIYSRTDNKKVSGSIKKRSHIINTANNVTLGGGGSQNDILDGSDAMKEVYLFAGTSGKDLITNFGKEDTLYINSGSIVNQTREGTDYVVDVKSGDAIGTVTLGGAGIYDFEQDGKKLTVKNVNYIFNETDNKKVTGISKEDFITNSGKDVTIQAGKGNDTIYGSNFGDMYLFSNASGDDVILNFDKDDTLKSTSGTISAVDVDGDDVIVSIKQKDQKAVGTVTLKKAADLKFFKQVNSTTLVIDDVNFIDNDKDGKKVTGTAKRDYITNDGENVTIQAGAGDDTINGSDLYGETFLFSYASGNDVITNVGENDTLRSTNGTISAVETVNDDLVVSIKKKGQSAVGKITLQGAASLNAEHTSSYWRFIPSVKPIYATYDDQKVTGTTNNDYIINPSFERVSIQAGKGNDTIDGSIFGETFLFSYASDDDLITNFDAKDTVRSTSGTLSYKLNGDNVIVSIKKGSTTGTVTLEGAAIYKANLKQSGNALYVDSPNVTLNTDDNKKITGTTGVDYISNTGENVTIQAGAGNDVLTGSDEYGDRFLFSYASGNDTITNFSLGDTVQSTSGTVSYTKSGNDYIVSITKSGQKSVGTITLKDAVTNYTLQQSGKSYVARPKSSSAQLPSDDYWFINDKSVEENELSAIVEHESAVDMPTDFNDVFKQSTVELATNARHRQNKSVK